MTTLKDEIRDIIVLYIDERKHIPLDSNIGIVLDSETLVENISEKIKEHLDNYSEKLLT